jgi:hypothetical protein
VGDLSYRIEEWIDNALGRIGGIIAKSIGYVVAHTPEIAKFLFEYLRSLATIAVFKGFVESVAAPKPVLHYAINAMLALWFVALMVSMFRTFNAIFDDIMAPTWERNRALEPTLKRSLLEMLMQMGLGLVFIFIIMLAVVPMALELMSLVSEPIAQFIEAMAAKPS